MYTLFQLIFYFVLVLSQKVTGSLSQDSIKKCIENALIIDSDGYKSNNCEYIEEITSSQAIRQLRDKWIVFMGESTLRQLFLQFLGIIKSETYDRIPDQKGEQKIEERLAGSRFTFYYLEYFDNLTLSLKDGPPKLYDGRYPDLLILNDGLHDLLYDYENIDKSWTELSNIIKQFKLNYNNKVPMMWIPSAQIYDDYLTKHRKDAVQFNNNTLYNDIISKQEKLYKENDGYQFYYNTFRNITYNKWNFDGIHNMERARIEANGLIRCFYYLNHDPNSWENDQITTGQIMIFIFYAIITIIVLFGQIFKYQFYRKSDDIFNRTHDSINDVELDTLLTHQDGINNDNNHNLTISVKYLLIFISIISFYLFFYLIPIFRTITITIMIIISIEEVEEP